jgi:hypothetical protein
MKVQKWKSAITEIERSACGSSFYCILETVKSINCYRLFHLINTTEINKAVIFKSYIAKRRAGIAQSVWWLVRGARPRDRSSSPGKGMIFLISKSSKPVLGPIQPPLQGVPGSLSPGVKWLGREADHSPPTGAEVKDTWICTSIPPYVMQ